MNCKNCGKFYAQRQGLNKHRRENPECADKRIIITEPAENNFLQITYPANEETYVVPDGEIDEGTRVYGEDDPEPPYNPHGAYPSFDYYKQPNAKKPLFASPNLTPNVFSPMTNSSKTVPSRYSPTPTPNYYNAQNYDSCENLLQQIEQFLANKDTVNAENAAQSGVMADRKLHEIYLHSRLPEFQAAQEKESMELKELEREFGITQQQTFKDLAEFDSARNLKDVDTFSKVHFYSHKFFLFQKKYNERFVFKLQAMLMMKKYVDDFKNFKGDLKRESGPNPAEIKEMLETSEKKVVKKMHKKIFVIVAVVVFVVIFCCVYLVFYSWVDLMMFVVSIGSAVFIFKHKDAIVDAVN
jgi:hypothetical protein